VTAALKKVAKDREPGSEYLLHRRSIAAAVVAGVAVVANPPEEVAALGYSGRNQGQVLDEEDASLVDVADDLFGSNLRFVAAVAEMPAAAAAAVAQRRSFAASCSGSCSRRRASSRGPPSAKLRVPYYSSEPPPRPQQLLQPWPNSRSPWRPK